ncbi:SCF ubiquitin ligase complex subunit cdc4 [Coemansia sp. RSA 1721]|nr:SCF ubiquitin ligase complex subunit cdc4 [Coemansia sp. RSA 1721]
MPSNKPNSSSSSTRKQQQQQQQQQHLSTQGSPLLPSPLETSSSIGSTSNARQQTNLNNSAFSYAETRGNNLPMLSAQTVTTTTVTTTTVTTYPPLKLPRVDKQKTLQPEVYPLASVPAPPALQQFALDVNDQQLYFSQNDLVQLQNGDILATIAENISEESAFADGMDAADVPRAMTPLYTQDDATKHAERQMRQLMHKTPKNSSAAAAAAAVGGSQRRYASAYGVADKGTGSAVRRSSSPPASGERNRHYGRSSYSPSPPPSTLPQSQTAQQEQQEHQQQEDLATVSSLDPAAQTHNDMAADDIVDAEALEDGVLPLPSPLLSPRARPESMDTDEILDQAHFGTRRQLRYHRDSDMSPPISASQSAVFDTHDGFVGYVTGSTSKGPFAVTEDSCAMDDYSYTRTTTRTAHEVANQPVAKGMAAVYSLPSIMATYDNLPPNMQTYLLYQLLRRTPRPALQFAAQTMLPVLHRDFIGGLPAEVSHHVLKFMDTRALCRASCVSHTWRRVVDGDRAVWRAKLIDARYVPEAPRVHPLCHTYFGLGPEPSRPVTYNQPTSAELSFAQLAPREMTVPPAYPMPSTAPGASNPFKAQFARSYRLDRNWQEGRSRKFSFLCDGGNVVTCVQLTEKYIIAGFDTKFIYVFDINTGDTVRQLVGHEGGVWALAVVGNTVISGSTDRSVRVWDLETGRCTHVFTGHSSTVRCLQVLLPTDMRTARERALGFPVRYEPAEPLIITGSRDTTLRVWRLPSPKKDTPYRVVRAAMTPLAQRMAGGAVQPQAPGHQTAAAAVANEADDSHMAVDNANEGAGNDDEDNTAGASASASPSQRQPANRESSAEPASIPTRPKLAATAAQSPNPYFLRSFEGHTDSVRAVAGHGNMVVSGSYDCTIRVWNIETGAMVHQLEGHTSKVYTIVLDPDQHLIFSGSMDGTIRVWNWDTGACLRILRGHLTLVGLLALKHGTLVSAGADTTLRIWDHPMKNIETNAARQRPFSNIPGDTIVAPPHLPAAPSNPQHQALAQNVGNLQQVHLLQQLQLQQRANDQLHQQQVDTTADMIRHETFVLRQHTNAITCFQHDGTKIVSGADSTLKLWDVRTGAFVRDLLSNLNSVWQVQFDKRRCVAAVNRNEVTYFEVMDFQQ